MSEEQRGYDEAYAAIRAGTATARTLWTVLSSEAQRDGYAIKPSPWDGPGEYQHVEYDDGRSVFVRIPYDGLSLPTKKQEAQA